jgi:hypothetical protein
VPFILCVPWPLCGRFSLEQRLQFFIHLKKEKDLLALCLTHGRELIRFYPGSDLVTDVVDAEHVARQKRASGGREEKAA